MIKKAMIMAAGVGSRLDPLTRTTPKPLIPIVNQPVMDLLLNHLSKYGIKDIVANTHCLAEKLQHRYENQNPTDVNCSFVYEQELSGTAGGVKKCEWFFEDVDSFLIMSGDGLTNVDLEALIDSHISSGAIATMGLTTVPVEEVKHFGVVVTDDSNRVVEFQEKPSVEEARSNLVNTGIYVFKKEIFNYIPEGKFYDFAKNVFPSLMAENKSINTFVVDSYWSDIGTMNQYRISTADVLEGRAPVDIPYKKIDSGFAANPEKIGKISTKEANLLIGENTVIENGVAFSGNNVIGKNSIIKSGAQLKDCIIWNNVEVGENVKLDNCIIANNVKIAKNANIEPDAVIAVNSNELEESKSGAMQTT